MSYKKIVIDVEEWNEWYKELINNLEPYDHYDMGYGDAVYRIDDWMDTQLFVDDGVYLTREEYDKLLEYKHMYEDLCK